MAAGREKMTEILDAAGAEDTVTIERYAHLVGGCRMGADRTAGVVDRDLRSFAIPNLYITDGSVLPTQGSANPALTIMALAARCAAHLTSRTGPSHDRSRRRVTLSCPRTPCPPSSPSPTARSAGIAPSVIVAEPTAAGQTGLGFTYSTACRGGRHR